jgi:hypothetical protein
MNLYRFHFLNDDGAVVQRHPMRLPTHAAALKLGQRMQAKNARANSFVVWHLNHAIEHG